MTLGSNHSLRAATENSESGTQVFLDDVEGQASQLVAVVQFYSCRVSLHFLTQMKTIHEI